MARQQSCGLPSGSKARRGLVFSVDIIIAVAFGLLLLIIAQGFLSVSDDPLSSLQISRMGSDIAAALDHTGALDTLDDDEIEDALEELVPVRYGMRLLIQSREIGEDDEDELEIGDVLPANAEIFSGKRVFAVADDGDIAGTGIVQYYIWVR